MIRQTDDVRISDRCKEPTRYYASEIGFVVKPSCAYYKHGECTLKACVRKGEDNDRKIYS